MDEKAKTSPIERWFAWAARTGTKMFWDSKRNGTYQRDVPKSPSRRDKHRLIVRKRKSNAKIDR